MEVVLLEDVKKLGKKGDVVVAANGYARNYLIPRKLAKEATKSILAQVKIKQSALEHHKLEQIALGEEIKSKIDGKTVIIKAKAGSESKLFGAVTTKNVAEALKENFDVTIDKRKLSMDDIKVYGTYECIAKVYTGVQAKVFVTVKE